MSRSAFARALLATGLVAGLAGAAGAQTQTAPTVPVQPQPRDPNMPPLQDTVPEKVDSTGSTGTLSDKLNQSGGIVRPTPDVDSKMITRTPGADTGAMPVVRPPGMPGGDTTIQPK